MISYDHYYPDQAAAGLEFAVQKLRDKVHALTLERVLVRKAFLEERLAAVEQDRTAAQDALIAFQREFGVVNLNAQSESALQHLTSLKTDLYRKEVELHSQIELLGENTAAVVRLRSEVDKLRTLIAGNRARLRGVPGILDTAQASCPRWGSATWTWRPSSACTTRSIPSCARSTKAPASRRARKSHPSRSSSRSKCHAARAGPAAP